MLSWLAHTLLSSAWTKPSRPPRLSLEKFPHEGHCSAVQVKFSLFGDSKISIPIHFFQTALEACTASNESAYVVDANEAMAVVAIAEENWALAKEHMEKSVAISTKVRFFWKRQVVLHVVFAVQP